MMKLLIIIVNRRDARRLHEALVEQSVRFTEISSTGGFLGQGNVTLLLGVAAEEVEGVLEVIGECCRAREEVIDAARPETRLHAAGVPEAMTVRVGGAHVFVLSVERVVEM
jgi:uncharacterized protein YaaQ